MEIFVNLIFLKCIFPLSIHRCLSNGLYLCFLTCIYTCITAGWEIECVAVFNTAGFMKTVPSAYTLLMNTIYLYPSTQEAEVTVFRKHTIYVILMYVYIFVCQYMSVYPSVCAFVRLSFHLS